MTHEKFERLNREIYEREDSETALTNDDHNEIIMTDGSHHI